MALGTEEVHELLRHLGAPETLRGRLTEVAAGNPLFAEELVAMLADQGAFQEPDLERIDLPIGLNAILSARLDRLESEVRDALERGAIEGEVFHRGAVVELSAPDARSGVPARLEALAEHDFVYPVTASFAGDAAFRFKHLLVREAAYRATAKRLRATLHEAFALWLERVAGDRINEFQEILGYHLEQAFLYLDELGPTGEEECGLGERAAAHLVAAARRAAGLSDFEAVASLIRRALALGVADPRERLRIQFELGYALQQTAHVAQAETVLTETHDAAVQLGVDDVAARALVLRAWNRSGDPSLAGWDAPDALEMSEQAIEVLTGAGDDRGLVLARRFRGLALVHTVDFTAGGLELERALRNAQASGEKEMIRLAIGSLTNAYLAEGPTPAGAAIERCENLLETARGDRVLEATVKRPLALFYAMSARPADALCLLREASDVLDELELKTAQVYRRHAAYALELGGDLDAAERESRAIRAYFRALRPDQLDNRARYAIVELARLYCDQSRWDEAAEAMADADSLGRDPQRAGWTGSAREIAVEARLAAHRGSPDAVPQAKEAIERSERRMGDLTTRAIVLLALAEVERSAGLAWQAGDSRERALELFELKGNTAAAAALERRNGPFWKSQVV